MFSRGMMPPVLEKPSDTAYGPIWRFMWRIFPGSYIIEQMFYRCLNELFYFAFDDNPLGRAVTKVRFEENDNFWKIFGKFLFKVFLKLSCMFFATTKAMYQSLGN